MLLIGGAEATGLSVVSFTGSASKSLSLASVVGDSGVGRVSGSVGDVSGVGWTLVCGLLGFAIFINPLNGFDWFVNRFYSQPIR